MKTPVLFLIFNRPELTFRVFEEIRKAKPEQLFIAGDGPRENKTGEAEECIKTRSIIDKIDWGCDVKTLFRDKNLGCKTAVSSAINWFFENVEEGVILEDDCLPNQSFFFFCEMMLEKYRSEEKVMHIGGCNFQDGIKRGNASYYFSKYPVIWGWATWKRAWKHYDIEMKSLDSFFESEKIKNIHPQRTEQNYWRRKFSETKKGLINTWDYQWVLSCWVHSGVSVMPQVNLITNIGFSENATHTHNDSALANMPTEKLEKITDADKIWISRKADKYIFETIFGRPFPKWNDLTRTYLSSLIPVKVKEKIKKWRV